ncbi:MAG: hypothetical protein DMG11_23910 [Acidobacteria bacterium]|nr:MAG: hypothetical protein DMG11_23910 [Acidobacteriota bacterium]
MQQSDQRIYRFRTRLDDCLELFHTFEIHAVEIAVDFSADAILAEESGIKGLIALVLCQACRLACAGWPKKQS